MFSTHSSHTCVSRNATRLSTSLHLRITVYPRTTCPPRNTVETVAGPWKPEKQTAIPADASARGSSDTGGSFFVF